MVIKEKTFYATFLDATSKQRLPSKHVQHPTDSEQTLRDKTAVPSGTALENRERPDQHGNKQELTLQLLEFTAKTQRDCGERRAMLNNSSVLFLQLY